MTNRKLNSSYNIKILNRLWGEIYVNFHWTLQEKGHFCLPYREITPIKYV